MAEPTDLARFDGWRGRDLVDVTDDLSALDGSGRWAVVLPFEGRPTLARFARWERVDEAPGTGVQAPPPTTLRTLQWTSSLDRDSYSKGVRAVREAIAAGDVYQVNLCRRLSTPVASDFEAVAFGTALLASHPAPHAAIVSVPSAGLAVVSASPERFLRRHGLLVESQPIKGTAARADGFTGKDRAENVMIVDLVRNDLGRVCEYGSVTVRNLCRPEAHPGLHHLVSTVRGQLRPGVGWSDVLAATFPPGSVTGAPKLAALDLIGQLEPVPRSVYCGAVGWIDADRAEADLNVAIRTFWLEDGSLHLGTGAGITWGSTPDGEWEETELKAGRLLRAAAAAAGVAGVAGAS